MKTKKILTIILCLSMLFIFAVPVSASATASIRVMSVGEAVVGSIVNVPIVLEENSGFVSLSVKVLFDSSALTLETVTDTGKLIGGYFEGYYDSPYYLVWENDIATKNNTYTGEIAILQFRVNEDATPGTYRVEIIMDDDGAIDKDGNSIEFALYSGTITITESKHECSFGDWEEYSTKKHIRYCNGCDEYELEAHSYDSWKNDDDEQHMRSCPCGEVEYEDHNWDNGVITKEPSSTANGTMTYTCTVCDATRKEDILPEEHKHNYVQHQVIAPTCTQGGYTIYKCSDSSCNATKQDDFVVAKGHQYLSGTCTDCGAVDPDASDIIPVTGITLSESSVEMLVDSEVAHRIYATISPENATDQNLKWTTSDVNVADVAWSDPSRAFIIAKGVGTAIITVSTPDGKYTAQCVVTVMPNPEVTGLTLNKESVVIIVDHSQTITATIFPENLPIANLKWTTSDESITELYGIAGDTRKCIIKAKCAGTAIVTVSSADGKYTAQCVVTVEPEQNIPTNPNNIPVTGLTLSESSVVLMSGKKQWVYATISPENATNQNIIWTTSDETVAGIRWIPDNNSEGVIVAKGVGTAIITASTPDGKYTAQCVVTVKPSSNEGESNPDVDDPKPQNSAAIIIDSCEAIAGEIIKVNVSLADNPGLASLVLKASYDQSLLTLTKVEYNTSMGGQTVPPTSLTSPVTLYWVNGFENYDKNEVFATLTFTVSESAKKDDKTIITVTYNADDVFNINDENVNLNITAGTIAVIDYIPGDINGDGVVNNKDVTRFMQYNAGWDVDVNTVALDVNGDGSVNNKDVTRLMQYNAGWNVEIH